ncbi:membrane protein [Mycobacterium phage JacoRen57]|nr:membrane protein [Mycobacterium phage JacoRen57]
MTLLNELFSGPENALWFLAGMLSVQAWQWIKSKWKDRVDPVGAPHPMKTLNWFYVWTAVVLVVIAGVGFQGSRTYSFAEQLAKDTRDCQIEFNRVLRERGAISQDNDHWSQVQRKALADWVHDLIFPPPHIAALPPESHERQKWIISRTTLADEIIQAAQKEQDRNKAERPEYPNDPTCGKVD